MHDRSPLKVALLGNPNAGKSSLFNHLTGLNQKVGNFPGVTVEKKSGRCKISSKLEVEITDLPGSYSLYPRSMDEKVVFDILGNSESPYYPDIAILVVDVSNLKRNLLLSTQVNDLGIPVILALNMIDIAEKSGKHIVVGQLSASLNAPVVPINARLGKGLGLLKETIEDISRAPKKFRPILEVNGMIPEGIGIVAEKLHVDNEYRAFHHLLQESSSLSASQEKWLKSYRQDHQLNVSELQARETVKRYEKIGFITQSAVIEDKKEVTHLNRKLDKVLTHRFWGYLIFFSLLFFVFQAIFKWATYPMDAIDLGFSRIGAWLVGILPSGILTDLLTEGIVPGIAGVMIFIPQIAILFGFIAILEESGYMGRVMFLMDKVMRKFGLNGKSVVPLISGVACAIPAILAARNIGSWKDRLITIFVTPLMSCSARLPIYTILIALVVPNETIFGFFSLQGLALMGLYLLGFFMALFTALLLKWIIRMEDRSFFIMELPQYRMPRWQNVGIAIYQSVKSFVWEAGRIILAIAIVLWVLASYGPKSKMADAEDYVRKSLNGQIVSQEVFDDKVDAYKLENSFAGIVGRAIEPAIKPLGFDWKIGISLITSFAAREVFVGTMATIYSVGSKAEDDLTIRKRLQAEINPTTGEPRFTPALGFSLLIFYAFAMQCMSTLAVVYKETRGWKWPALQLVYMTGLAYLASLLVYNLFS